ncbi:hypothetical protein Q3A66_10505 [Hymenobacter sp. BT770]|uniref:hypothetical protein n=1 Tax=Hymenobacter sp. BT770 TaxID=2886942 RepID=UPI001D12862F|nr:hypothetical protein [Hymenobacter sp. BT770]MCC3153418.1 hypothetical protein [Hymenobacter sp. BT770]MDO3415500.1 hypothetical protein [Hymenobacter sp. BT770]
MISIRSTGSVLVLLVLSCLSAQAQSQSVTVQSTVVRAAGAEAASPLTRYTAVRDSLMRRVDRVHAQAELRMASFKSTRGSFGGLHRRVRSYDATTAPFISDTGVRSATTHLVKSQLTKQRDGIELEKVRYYDPKGRLVLSEQYEGHRLTQLELLEYPELLNVPTTTWLLVRGDYIMRTSNPDSITKTPKKISYYFSYRPNAE